MNAPQSETSVLTVENTSAAMPHPTARSASVEGADEAMVIPIPDAAVAPAAGPPANEDEKPFCWVSF